MCTKFEGNPIAITVNIPQTVSKATRELLGINRNIKKQMKQCKKLYRYNKAKHLQNYRKVKNNVTTLICESHRNYQCKNFLMMAA